MSHIESIKKQTAKNAKELGVFCPKCGSADGFYHKAIYAHTQFIGFDNKPTDCHIEFVRGGTKKHCSNCEKDITDFVNSLNLNE